MNNNKVIHILCDSPITKKFLEFMNINFDTNHIFVNINKKIKYLDTDKTVNFNVKSISDILKFIKLLNKKEKIIIHGLFDPKLILILLLQPWLLTKCYWVMWGGDFYFPKKQSWIKKQVIKKMGHFLTYIKGDYELAQKWYGANGKYHECFMYPSNLYKEYAVKEKSTSTINIQVGNSADPSNNHLEVLDKLVKYKNENIKIFVPLSYGDEKYANEVIAKGKELFEDKFIALTEFIAFDKYLDFLGDIDIAIFAHRRQQAMGNTITLLGLGKKVYIRSDVTPWELFNDIDVKVFDVENINVELIAEETKVDNQRKIKEYFSEENYLEQLQNLFESR